MAQGKEKKTQGNRSKKSRGGIQKATKPARIDPDGDLQMAGGVGKDGALSFGKGGGNTSRSNKPGPGSNRAPSGGKSGGRGRHRLPAQFEALAQQQLASHGQQPQKKQPQPQSQQQSHQKQKKEEPSAEAVQLMDILTKFLGSRYNVPDKSINLASMASETGLVELGMFSAGSTESKFFPVLMKVCESNIPSLQKRREQVERISLANNNISNVTHVSSLSQTFPDLKALDLSSNNIKDFDGLRPWRWRFRDIESFNLSGNPISADPNFKEIMMKWYPMLQVLNDVPIRSPEEIARLKKTPIPCGQSIWIDQNDIAQNFIRVFFPGYDSDRAEVVRQFYGDGSQFSLSVDTSLPRANVGEAAIDYNPYIKKSRNFKVTHAPARNSRLYTGAASIREVFKSLPDSQHPELTSPEYLFECYPLPGLPDPTATIPEGTAGLMVITHGKFDSLDSITKQIKQTFSFDRTFVLGAGNTPTGVRVYDDMLTIRPYSGNEAFIPEIAGQP